MKTAAAGNGGGPLRRTGSRDQSLPASLARAPFFYPP